MAFYITGEWVRFCAEGDDPCPRSVDCDYCHA